MRNLKKRLPPLEPLIAFECAARHLSFTLAANELNLSQAAVSQQIRNLENALGVELFVRSHRSIELSNHGRIFRYSIVSALNQIASATTELKAPSKSSRLTIAVDQSIASMWLVPRLPDFQRSNPGIMVRLIASDIEQDCLSQDIDIAIIHGDGKWSNFVAELLFPEEVFPVCSPTYLGDDLTNCCLTTLTDKTLLSLENIYWNWMDWRTWLSSNDIHLPMQHRGLQINSYPLVIEAAKNGQGIALGWRYLIDDSLADGSLIKPFDTSVSTVLGYHMVWPEVSDSSINAAIFRDWARSQLSDK